MDYGERITREIYHQGRLKRTPITYISKKEITNKSDIVSHFISALQHIDNKETCEIIVKVVAEPRTFKIKRFEKEYEVEG